MKAYPSSFVARSLEARIEAVRGFRTARDRQLRLLSQGVPLGTGGRIPGIRESLHER